MNKIKVSIIVPIYNMEKYLNRCIESILNQDYQNIELILVNDGSTDNSINICNGYKKQSNIIKVIDKENGGVSSARNFGINVSEGEWIMFVDPDDYLKPNIVSTLVKNIDEKNDIICCSCVVNFDSNYINSSFFRTNFIAQNIGEKKKLFLQLIDFKYEQDDAYTAIGVPWGKIYRKNFLKKNNLNFDIKLKRMQDNIFNMYAFYFANSIKYINEPLYVYNYEHMNKSIFEYTWKDIEITNAKVYARKEALIKTGLINDMDIYSSYINELSIFLTKIIKDIVLSVDNKHTRKERILYIKEICHLEIYKDLINKINIIMDKKQKVVIFMIKHKYWNLIYILFKLYKVMRGR